MCADDNKHESGFVTPHPKTADSDVLLLLSIFMGILIFNSHGGDPKEQVVTKVVLEPVTVCM